MYPQHDAAQRSNRPGFAGFAESARGAVPGLLLARFPRRSPYPPCGSPRNGLSVVRAVGLVRESQGAGMLLPRQRYRVTRMDATRRRCRVVSVALPGACGRAPVSNFRD